VVHGDESPVRDYARNANPALAVGAGDEILHGSGIEQLDIGELQDLREDGACEQRGVLDDLWRNLVSTLLGIVGV